MLAWGRCHEASVCVFRTVSDIMWLIGQQNGSGIRYENSPSLGWRRFSIAQRHQFASMPVDSRVSATCVQMPSGRGRCGGQRS